MSEEAIDTSAANEPTADTTEQNPAPDAGQAATGTMGQGSPIEEDGLVGEESKTEGSNQKAEVPETYSTEGLEVPEDMEIDMPTVEALSEVAKEIGLSQEKFNTLYNKMMPVLNDRLAEQIDSVRGDFIKEAKADPEIGGAKWSETLTIARKALFQFTDEGTRDLLKASGLDCHPGIIRAFLNVGKAMSDDTVLRGSTAAVERDAARSFFYNSKMN